MEKIKQKFVIHYNTGLLETTTRINPTFLHMIDIGLIKSIFDCEENHVWKLGDEGHWVQIKVDDITALI